jgi:hypothetical protein
MERLKGAIEGALTKRNLSIALKKEQMECVSSIVDGRDVLAVLCVLSSQLCAKASFIIVKKNCHLW